MTPRAWSLRASQWEKGQRVYQERRASPLPLRERVDRAQRETGEGGQRPYASTPFICANTARATVCIRSGGSVPITVQVIRPSAQ
jgi:hypothetical protein